MVSSYLGHLQSFSWPSVDLTGCKAHLEKRKENVHQILLVSTKKIFSTCDMPDLLVFVLAFFQDQWKWSGKFVAAFLPFHNTFYNRSFSACGIECGSYLPSNRCPGSTHSIARRYLSYFLCPNLTNVREQAVEILYPVMNGPECTLVLLDNIAQPDWINVDCFDNLLPNVLCVIEEVKENKTEIKLQDMNLCHVAATALHKECFTFLWVDSCTKISSGLLFKTALLKNFTWLESLFMSVRSPFPVLMAKTIGEKNAKPMVVTKCEKHFDNLVCYYLSMTSRDLSGFVVLSEAKDKLPTGGSVFQCKVGGSITLMSLCNGIVECPQDTSD